MISAADTLPESPSIAIVIASLQDDEALRASIESCLSQEAVQLQLVVALKAATDPPAINTTETRGKTLTVVRRDDLGIADAWNFALDQVRADLIGFLGAGDRFHSTTSLSDLLAGLPRGAKPASVLYGNQQIVLPDGRLKPFPAPPVGREKRALEGHMVIPHASSLWPMSLLKRQRFDNSFRIAIDYEYALRTLAETDYVHVAVPVAVITADGLSNNPSSLLRVIAEDARAKRKNGFSRFSSIGLNAKRIIRWMISQRR